MARHTGAADIPKSPTCLHAFSRLPGELRWKIWQMAICTDETPRIHYYSFFNTDHDGYRQSHLQQMMRAYSTERSTPEPHTLEGRYWVPPVLRSLRKPSFWTGANRFLYLWDAGLLTACKESHAVLLQHLNKAPRRPCPTPKRSNMTTTHHQGDRVYVEVCSQRDIVCFRFAPEDMAACASMRWEILLPLLPFFHLPQAPGMNLALEFDDSWDEGLGTTKETFLDGLKEASPRGLAMRAHWAWKKGLIPRWTRMWLIDRGGGLPADFRVSREDDGRHKNDSFYPKVMCKPEDHHIFIDGKNRYVESYMWDGQLHEFGYRQPRRTVPVLSFIWKMHRRCRPEKDGRFYHTLNVPSGSEYFFRVLRQLPDTDGRG